MIALVLPSAPSPGASARPAALSGRFDDAAFGARLRAGAARLVLSVRVGFEHAVALFLETGQSWDSGGLPPIGSPLYVSIIEEIWERDKAPGTLSLA